MREWLLNMSRRRAEQRTAHLFCELLVRLQSIELATNGGFELPITQTDLADVLGLSVVRYQPFASAAPQLGPESFQAESG